MRISFLNGQFIDHDKAYVHIEDRAFQFADSIYEVILFKNGKLIDGKPHLERLYRSLAEINIAHGFLQDEIEKNALELFKRNNLDDGFVYMQISRGVHNRIPWLPKGITPTFVMTVAPAKIVTAEDFEKGVSLMSHDDIRWHRVDIKTTGLLASTLINQKAKDLGFDDALFVRDGVVTEASYANFFIVDKDGIIVTKPADECILKGITRGRVIALARENGIEVVERDFGLKEVKQAREAFLTSSTLMVRAAVKIDGAEIGDGKAGEVTRWLKGLYEKWVG